MGAIKSKKLNENLEYRLLSVSCDLRVFVRMCFACVREGVRSLTVINELYIRAICFCGFTKQPQITLGNMFLKRASHVRCCLERASRLGACRRWTIFPYCISQVRFTRQSLWMMFTSSNVFCFFSPRSTEGNLTLLFFSRVRHTGFRFKRFVRVCGWKRSGRLSVLTTLWSPERSLIVASVKFLINTFTPVGMIH